MFVKTPIILVSICLLVQSAIGGTFFNHFLNGRSDQGELESVLVLSGDDDEEEKVDPEQEKKEQEKEKAKEAALAQQKDIRELFSSSTVTFQEEGEIRLVYDFSSFDELLAVDFFPKFSAYKKNQLRWSYTNRGTGNTVSDGVHFAIRGTWLHKAQWQDVEMELEYAQLSEIHKKGDLICAIYAWDKGKHMLASNLGSQILRLNRKMQARRGLPKKGWPSIIGREERKFGYILRNGIFTGTFSGRKTENTNKDVKFVKGLKAGHAGLLWNGKWTKGVVSKITLKGKLDAIWLKKEIKKNKK